MSIDFHRLVKPIDINPLIFINLIYSDDWFSSIGLAGVLLRPQLWFEQLFGSFIFTNLSKCAFKGHWKNQRFRGCALFLSGLTSKRLFFSCPFKIRNHGTFQNHRNLVFHSIFQFYFYNSLDSLSTSSLVRAVQGKQENIPKNIWTHFFVSLFPIARRLSQCATRLVFALENSERV